MYLHRKYASSPTPAFLIRLAGGKAGGQNVFKSKPFRGKNEFIFGDNMFIIYHLKT